MLYICNILFLSSLHHLDWIKKHHIDLYFINVVRYLKPKTCYTAYINISTYLDSVLTVFFPENRSSFVTSTVETKWMKGFVQMRQSKVRILTCWFIIIHGKCLHCWLFSGLLCRSICWSKVFHVPIHWWRNWQCCVNGVSFYSSISPFCSTRAS